MRFVVSIVLIAFSINSIAQSTCDKTWWKESVFYEIYMPSFKDSDGDGFSDFKGLTASLNYLDELGVKGIWLTPFLQSPKVDNGYDVSDYLTVDPAYGSNEDFKYFLKKAHSKGIKVIMDMVVNHTSTDHYWFKEAQKSTDNPFRDYYIWKNEDEINNWESFFGGTAWELDSLTNQYYYHQFDVKMADLNWANPALVDEIMSSLRFWLDMGVDGFRLDVINFLTTNGIGQNNPVKDGKQEHLYDKDQAGVKEAIRKIKSVVNEYPNRFIVGEVGSENLNELASYRSDDLLDVVFNFNFGSIAEFSADSIFKQLKMMEDQLNGYPTLFFGSHDMPRMMSRLADNNVERAKTLAALMLSGKGVPFIYYGEEIGMQNLVAKSYDDIRDIQAKTHYRLAKENGANDEEALKLSHEHNRDRSRSPMQWNANTLAGFSNASSWIAVNEDYTRVNVAAQQNDSSALLHVYQQLIKLRNTEPALSYGEYTLLQINKQCIHFIRQYKSETIEGYFNFGEDRVVELLPGSKVLAGSTELKENSFVLIKRK